MYFENKDQNGERQQKWILLGVYKFVVGDEDVKKLIELDDPGDDEQLGGKTVIFLPDEGGKDKDGDVEGGSVEEVGKAQGCKDQEHEFGGDFDHGQLFNL